MFTGFARILKESCIDFIIILSFTIVVLSMLGHKLQFLRVEGCESRTVSEKKNT